MEPDRDRSRYEQRQQRLYRQLQEKEARKARRRRRGPANVWFGLGLMGVIGWAVAVPTVVGIALGVFVDSRFPSSISWTLNLLLLGIALGCLNAWYWVSRERQKIEEDPGRPRFLTTVRGVGYRFAVPDDD